MDLLTAILVGVAAFVIFILLTAYFMKSALYMNKEVSKTKQKRESENNKDAVKK
ncbi:hypothetical protein [Methanolobus bombayensis]|uniref:hypothetical protein n=1 Tax=Methanolobus bombayensis TaxID=38023 RepID=UPI001AE1F88C|nr:hypothetical protein [Methanolobus bombayensis]MBP1910679.1 putative membrane protein [Methanolobus bombayensis]